jgi:hypothetical protein
MKLLNISASLLLLLSSVTHAKVDQQHADTLGNELTPIGAQVSGNSAGTIPAYTGGLKENANSDPFHNIYADEKPLFTITRHNVKQHIDNLSAGQLALFKRYPDTYKLPIYKTHRTSAYPTSIYQKAKKNAASTMLVKNGNGLTAFDETIPFAIPKSGLEVIWNHISRYRGGAVEKNSAQITVQRNGDFTPIKMRSQLSPPQYLSDGFDKSIDENILFYYVQSVKAPARYTGNVFLVHETIDQIAQPRMAWTYNSGQRRVRRAPQVAYDAPGQASDGLRTSDQLDMFNGAPDRYNWKLVGKKEVYIPYNAYKLADNNSKYQDIITPGHINQDYTRYELHRVWQVEATLKDNARHIYAKRTFYIDEDSWQIALADHFDHRGQLWRTAEGHALQFVNANTPWYITTTNYDLFSGRYIVELNNEERDAFQFNHSIERKDFTSAAIRRLGKR